LIWIIHLYEKSTEMYNTEMYIEIYFKLCVIPNFLNFMLNIP